ncbi:hypothetical protein ENSA5_69880 [Enhygromyxa salina]|uniref:DUF4347 domain-containing protein n=2 Tax=Enhygromyxa salina TaxID=215803 RepID=A0A2S9XAJ7_9BACT|nr:hypothetical protein ENSA5_69880 [Enhygromyxa salina]
MIYDNTCVGDFPKPGASSSKHTLGARVMRRAGRMLDGAPWPGLTQSWQVGGLLYSALGRLDGWRGFPDWTRALTWLAEHRADEAIGEVQFWGHGKWGCAKIDGETLGIDSLDREHAHNDALRAIRERMRGAEQPLWWFRTCETFGADSGRAFARGWTEFFDCRAAGHTYIIGLYQSGLHTLAPGQRPSWSTDEGLVEGTPDDPRQALWSKRREPNTITCFHGRIPPGF